MRYLWGTGLGASMNRTVKGCPNDHGPDGIIECWSPGGPCPDGRTVCEMCGECQYCLVNNQPLQVRVPETWGETLRWVPVKVIDDTLWIEELKEVGDDEQPF